MTPVTLALVALLAAAEPAKAPAPPAPAPAAAGIHGVELPAAPGAGEAKEVKAVLETPHLKLATITLRKGALLPSHKAPMPVTIVALRGAGDVVLADGTKQRLDATHMVALAPDVAHAVQPDAGTDMVILVHHLKPAGVGPGPKHGH